MTNNLTPRGKLSIGLSGTGRRFGHLELPWSRNDSAWGTLRIPLAILSNGEGPFTLLTAGNHGDEFEGPMTLMDLARTLDVDRVRGTIVIIPGLNYPALYAGTRLSPIDGLNMNRAFRRRRDGSITEQIADFVEAELVTRADAVLDIHSGGKTMFFHPFAAIHKLADENENRRAREALIAFGAPIGMVLEELDNEGMLDTAVESKGKLFVSTELGGGGSTTPETMFLARRGTLNFLSHIGAYDGDIERSPTRLMSNDQHSYIAADDAGLIEFVCNVGESVHAGQVIAKIHRADQIGEQPRRILARSTGMVLGRHFGGHIATGDFLALLAQDVE
jgi:N2-acetyl-L-2,4-diaminobutanoate deacetylase